MRLLFWSWWIQASTCLATILGMIYFQDIWGTRNIHGSNFRKQDSRKWLLILSMAHLFCNIKNKREAPNIRENELPGNLFEKNKNKGLHSCHNASLSSPSMALQDSSKERNNQRRRWFHNTPLNIPEIDFQMPNISNKFFSTFFGDASEDAEKHLINFKGTCYDFNLNEDNFTCILFLQTLRGNSLEWYSSLLPNYITN